MTRWNSRFSNKIFALTLLTCWLTGRAAFASFDFSPIIANLAPSGAGATASFVVNNYGDNKIPVQVTIVARDPDLFGKEDYKETDKVSEMFRIFPDQVVLNPKETRTIRITYIGSPKVSSELPFRIIAEELPVDVDDPKKVYKKAVARISIATKYIGSLYVTPAGSKPEVAIEVKQSAESAKKMILTIKNKGSSHQVIRKPVLKLQSLTGGKEVVLENTELKDLLNQNVLAGKERKFNLDWPKSLPAGPVKATLDLAKE